MSDLSWLNPTPHAIAVYASQPLSPVATQHSLPSGRYSLLGPDLHRLDRTSFRLAHLFDHLVGQGEQLVGNLQAKRLRYAEIDDQLELGRLHYWEVGRFLTFEDTAGVHADLAIGVGQVRSVGDESPGCSKLAPIVDRG